MTRIVRPLASLRLTLALLLLLALLGAAGSAIPQGLRPEDYARLYPRTGSLVLGLGLDHYYTGFLYRGLLALFAANLLACAHRRVRPDWRALRGIGPAQAQVPVGSRDARIAELRDLGFRVKTRHPLSAHRRRWAFLGFSLVHLAPPVVLAGGLWGSLAGFVGTQNVHVGQTTETYHNWTSRADERLPHPLAVEDFQLLYHPVLLRLKAIRHEGDEVTLEARTGQSLRVPGTAYRITLEAFDEESGDLLYTVQGPEGRSGPYSRGKEEGAPVRIRPLAWKDAEVRRAEAVVALRGGDGRDLVRQVVAVNEPLVYEGLRIYLTAWDQDQFGFPFVGFQIVRDPSQPVVWLGAGALACGLFLILFGNGAIAWEENGSLCLRGSRGRRSLPHLQGLSKGEGTTGAEASPVRSGDGKTLEVPPG